ncbi:MAG TPA: hypothetical protein PJ991_00420 [Kiritimatiellia bacterium]|nr:hypothetical protein [Kiritimatiellia bacterium]
MKHCVLDGIGPFFRHHPAGRINWSKIPFSSIEQDGGIPQQTHDQIIRDFEVVCRTASEWGYNIITLDDLAHLSPHADYQESLNRKLSDYGKLYRELFATSRRYGLNVWITTDIMFYEAGRRPDSGNQLEYACSRLAEILGKVFEAYPEVTGVIFRIGESDGHDVQGDFISQMIIRSPRQGRQLIDAILPVFERFNRLLIFRTWSVGAYKIGDLIWNQKTYDKLFGGISSEQLLVSIKYGESDFFRYLRLNPLFRKSGPGKIIELQARREYEGFGEYPSFIGRDFEHYRNEVKTMPDVMGFSVWCQTGGWSSYRRLTFLDKNAIWNEINTWICVKLFKDGLTAEGAVRGYFQNSNLSGRWDQLLELLDRSETVVKNVLYLDDFAGRRIYFRRLRIPPLLAVYWDRIFINGALRKIQRCFVYDGELKIQQAIDGLKQLDRMKELAAVLSLPVDDIEFEQDTLRLLALARIYYFRDVDEEILFRLTEAVAEYQQRYGDRAYHVSLDTKHWKMSRTWLKRVFSILLREKRSYRWLDRIITIRILSMLYVISRPFRKKFVPEFARKQAMGIDVIFR